MRNRAGLSRQTHQLLCALDGLHGGRLDLIIRALSLCDESLVVGLGRASLLQLLQVQRDVHQQHEGVIARHVLLEELQLLGGDLVRAVVDGDEAQAARRVLAPHVGVAAAVQRVGNLLCILSIVI